MAAPMATSDATLGSLYPDHLESVAARHDRALDKAGADVAVIYSGGLRETFMDDEVYPFVANPYFKVWAPLTAHPECYVVYRPGSTPRLVYYRPEDFWHQPPARPAGYWTDHFDVEVVSSTEAIREHLPGNRANAILIGEIDRPEQAHGIERINPRAALTTLDYLRAAKTEYELECMREAQRRAARGHRAAAEAFEDGAGEFDIHLAYCRAVGQTESELPYGNIIALNEHASVLHYRHLERERPEAHRSFLIDAGASFNGYAADVSRTYARDDAGFQSLIDAMDSLQRALVDEVRSGVDFRELHRSAHRRIAALLAEADLAKASPEALVEQGVTVAFFPHGLGHFLGLQVHDAGGFLADEDGREIDKPDGHPFLRLTRTLAKDHVVTIEPGLYFIPMLLGPLRETGAGSLVNWERVAALIPCGGIRVEDDVRVLDDGAENLTRDAFAAAASAAAAA